MGNCGAKETGATPNSTNKGTHRDAKPETSAPKKKPPGSKKPSTPKKPPTGSKKPPTSMKQKTPKNQKGSIGDNLISEKKQDFHETYEIVDRVGEGSISNISKIRKKQSATGNKDALYALKEIDTSMVKDEFLEEMYNEIALMKTLDHPNIIKAYETYDLPPKILAIVMELCTGGDLNSRGPYTEEETAKIVVKLVGAVNYLHKNNITHRDLKVENLMFENETPDAEVKVIDFGLSTRYIGGDHLTDRVGTIYTMSPQVMNGDYTSQADMWSIGVITFQLLSGEAPFWGSSRKEIIRKVKKAEYSFDAPAWMYVSDEAKDFVNHLLEVDPEKRWTAEKAIKSPWLRKESAKAKPKTDKPFADNIKQTLDDYKESAELKKLALHVIARKSSTDEIFQLRAAFNEFDKNDDGSITYWEFKQALTSLGYDQKDIDSMFRSVDVDGSGSVQYTEFLAATLEAHGRVEEQRVAEAFEQFDTDGNGVISKEELSRILGPDSSEAYVDQLMKEADLNGDGQISYDEFMNVFGGQTAENVCKMKSSRLND